MNERRTKTALIGLIVMAIAVSACSARSSSATWTSQRPDLGLPGGLELPFETVESDRLPIQTEERFYVIARRPYFTDINSRVTYNLYPETQARLSEIDYGRYFAVIAFQGHREFDKSGIRVDRVLQDGSTVNIIARVEDDRAALHSLVVTHYQIIKVDKARMPRYGLLTFRLIDQAGFVVATGSADVPDIRPPTPSTTEANPPSTTNDVIPPSPEVCSLEMAKSPKVGDSAELAFVLQDGSRAQAWLEFYWTNTAGSYLDTRYPVQVDPKTVVVSGRTSWQVNSPESVVTQKDTVRFPRPGIWEIRGFFHDPGGQLFSDRLQIAVKPDAALDISTMYHPSGFADIENLLRGERGVSSYTSPFLSGSNRTEPVLIELDLSKAPKPGEKVKLTCRAVSLHHDIPNFVIHVALWKRVLEQPDEYTNLLKYIDTPEKQYFVSGVLLWQGILKQGKAVEFSSTIAIPESGDWQIYAGGDALPLEEVLREGRFSQYSDAVTLTVADQDSSFGYSEISIGARIGAARSSSLARQWIGSPSYSAASSSIAVSTALP